MTRATAITVWEMGLPRLSSLHAVSRMDDHANRHRLMQGSRHASRHDSATRGTCGCRPQGQMRRIIGPLLTASQRAPAEWSITPVVARS
jgi:hypothetical protein